MTTTRSLRSRLAWSASAVVAFWLIALTVGANVLLGSALAGQADTLLRTRAEATAATVTVDAGGRVRVAEGQDDAALDLGTWIFADDGSAVEAPAGRSSRLDEAAAQLAARGTGTTDTGIAERLRLLAQPVDIGGRHVATVVTSASLTPYDQLRHLTEAASAALALGFLVAVHLVLRANVGRALRPVQEMTAQADRWSTDDVDRRFGAEPRPAELAGLAHTLDAVLERLAAVLRRERRLTDELGHELRTPLARLQAEVELLSSRPRSTEELAEAHAAIAETTTSMRQIIDTLISSARQDAGSLSGRGHVAPVVHLLGELLTADRGDLRFTVRIDPELMVGTDPQLLERLLSPVVANAARYAVHEVEVSAGAADGHVRVVLADDGPGVAAEDRECVFQPGWRGEPADGHAGAGLGLALARRLAEAAGGQISVGPDGPGGRFIVELPAA